MASSSSIFLVLLSAIFTLLLGIYIGWVLNLEDYNNQPQHILPLLERISYQQDDLVIEDSPTFTVKVLKFACSTVKCEAFFYHPKEVEKPPVIVMAHGFGAQKDFGLSNFAKVFANAGYAVFMFDYRHFGGSEGQPMNLISPTMQLEDWESALEYVSSSPLLGVNSSHIILWGTSFSGGHVIVTAAKSQFKQNIKGVISQVPFLRAISSLMAISAVAPLGDVLKLSFYGLVDKTRELFGRSRYYVPIYGPSSSMAILSSPSIIGGYGKMIPENPRGGWKNICPASIALTMALYNPHTFSRDVEAPTLIVYDTQDDLCPADDVKDMSKNMQNVHLLEFSHGHFSVYNELFEENVNAQVKFLKEINK